MSTMSESRYRHASSVEHDEFDDDESTMMSRPPKKSKSFQEIKPPETTLPSLHLDALLEAEPDDQDFENLINPELDDYLECRRLLLERSYEQNSYGQRVRHLTKRESLQALQQLEHSDPDSHTARLLHRKLKLDVYRKHHSIREPRISMKSMPTLEPMLRSTNNAPEPTVIEGLKAIRSTPYEMSLVCRIAGLPIRDTNTFISRDWITRSPWMNVMEDIREHHSIAHPERAQPKYVQGSIDFQPLHVLHLPQVHDLLERAFWPGIDVSDSFQYAPERCTVVATYKSLVVGAAFLSSPEETYMTYLVVRAGWEGSRIATTMLYHLIESNPHKDILLHVSANNPAMLLYNRFGFKAEEFIVGFYEDYLDKQARASKNAFRLRLRR